MLHAFWLPDSYVMAFWLESADDNTTDTPSTASAPYRILSDTLPAALDFYQERRHLLLPSIDGRRLPSTDSPPDAATLQAHHIVTAETIGDCAIEYLLSCAVETTIDRGLCWGASLRYWRILADTAQLMVDQGLYTPGIAVLEGRYYPAWQAVVNETFYARWEQLANAAPPVCCGLQLDADNGPRRDDSTTLALSFVDACVDYLVRHHVVIQSPPPLGARRTQSPSHRQWLDALRTGSLTYLRGPERTMERFAADVLAWNAGVRPLPGDSPVRLAVDLHSPPVASGEWRLTFGLSFTRDPSRRLSAERIWDETDPLDDFSDLPFPHEGLLRELGKAAIVVPEMAEGLRVPRPTGLTFDRQQAFDFVSQTVPKLERSGVVVGLPGWLTDAGGGLGLRLRVTTNADVSYERRERIGVEQLVNYRWETALGDTDLSADEFRQLAVEKTPLVFIRGQWTRLDIAALKRAVELFDKKGRDGKDTIAKALSIGLDHQRGGGLPVLDFEIVGDPQSSLSKIQPGHSFEHQPTPPGFVGELRHYQIVGFSWLLFLRQLGFGACLADDMGLGKTIQMIALLLHGKAYDDDGQPSLIVCPMSVVGNWARELARFAPSLTVMVHHGGERMQEAAFTRQAAAFDVVITTYTLVVRDQMSFLRCHWQNIILDEAQNIKNPTTKQTVAVRSIKGSHRYCLTGTPIENRLTELWSIMEFLNPRYLGSLSNFRANFAVPIERDQDARQMRILRKLISPFILRRLKSDSEIIRDLPEKQETKEYCNLTTEQAALYQAVVDDMLSSVGTVDGIGRRGVVLATLTKLKQITNHPVHFLRDNSDFSSARSGKLQRLEEMLDVVLAEGHKALIFTQFTEIGELLCDKLQQRFGVEVCYLHGATPQWKRDEMVHRFQRPGGPPVFLLSLKAGGTGLNLTAASHVFHFDRWWNPAVENQATDRAHRIGQMKTVQVHKFICVGTVEEKIDQMIEDKRELAENIVVAGANLLSDLSTDELRNIFSLSPEAIGE